MKKLAELVAVVMVLAVAAPAFADTLVLSRPRGLAPGTRKNLRRFWTSTAQGAGGLGMGERIGNRLSEAARPESPRRGRDRRARCTSLTSSFHSNEVDALAAGANVAGDRPAARAGCGNRTHDLMITRCSPAVRPIPVRVASCRLAGLTRGRRPPRDG